MDDACRVLLVEDDQAIGSSLVRVLVAEGHDVDWHTLGEAALAAAQAHPPDLVLLDLGLPDLDGVDVCRRLGELADRPAVIILTARAQEMDIVLGLDAGADDYLTKPFGLSELLARVRAHLRRRTREAPAEVVVVGSLVVDRAARRAWHSDTELDLRPKEFDLLALLAAEAGRAVTREHIMSEVWDANWFGSTKTLDQHIVWLRAKLAEVGLRDAITTLRGVGYRLEQE